jgi:tetratricopeptide (TPR) repeat protein
MKSGGPELPRALLLVLLLLPLLAVYYPALKAGYTNWDDPSYATENPLCASFTAAGAAAAFTSFRVGHYHPLTDVSMAAEAAVLGESAKVRHAGSLLLHAANAVLFFFLLTGLLGSEPAALAGALLWALLPVNVEAAAWIAERKTLLYAFFFLGALLCYLKRLKGGAAGWLWGAAGLFVLSLLSKATAVTLPLAMLALDWRYGRPLDRKNLAEKAGFFALAGLFSLAAAAAQGGRGELLAGNFPSLFSFYLSKTLWPAGLSALYPYREALAALRLHPFAWTLPAAAFAGALGWAVKKEKDAALGLLFFLVNILPFALIIPIGPALAADRYLYLASAGLALAACAAALRLPAGRARLPALAALFLAAALPAAAITRARVAVWRSSEALWTDVLQKYPRAGVANQNMAQVLLEKGDLPRAWEHLQLALADAPDNTEALYNLGTALARAGRPLEALPLLQKALRLEPGNAPAWNNLGLVLLQLDRGDEAARAFMLAAVADPSYAPARANLAATRAPVSLREKR